MIERITEDMPEAERLGHEFRYRLARGFIDKDDRVVDAACGTGYGADIIGDVYEYIGYDIHIPPELKAKRGSNRDFLKFDLTRWIVPTYPDVFIGFETIEHLKSYNNFIQSAKRAGKWIIVSAPIVPSKHINPYHLHDFESGDLAKLFVDNKWEEYQTIQQPSEVSEISIFRRRSV